jgi:uroporphyrinogen decarboxylase
VPLCFFKKIIVIKGENMANNFKLNYRENWLRTMNFAKPEYIMGGVGVRTDGWDKHGVKLNDLYQKYYGHRPYADDKIPHPDPKLIDENGDYHHRWTDEWGCVMEERVYGIHPMIVGHPFDSWEAFNNYTPPPKADLSSERIEVERKQNEESKKNGGLVIQHFLRVFERLQWLRGYTKLFFDFAEDPEELHRLADMVVDYNMSWIERSIAIGADGVGFSDDWGTQNALMIKPERWREFFKPIYKRMFDPIKEAGMLVHFHSDGYILDIIPDLKELGVDVLNIQTNCHDLEQLGKLCYDLRLCISSDMDRQGVLSFGTPQDVKDYFHKIAYLIGSKDGGLFFSCECGSDTPLENIEAAIQVTQEYQSKPLEEVPKKWG